MEEHHIYEHIGSQTRREIRKTQKSSCGKLSLYTEPNVAMMDHDDLYEEIQLSANLAITKQSQTNQLQSKENSTTAVPNTNEKTRDNVKDKKRGFFVVCIFVTVFAVVALAALAVSTLSFRGNSNLQPAVSNGSQDNDITYLINENNITYLMDEVNGLKSLLAQMNLETLGNISQLDDKLNKQSANIDIIESSITRHSLSGYSLSSSVNQMNFEILGNISQLDDKLSTQSANIDTISSSITWLSQSGYSLSTSVSQHRYTSIRRISTSVSSASSRAYWNSITIGWLSFSVSTVSSRAYLNSRSVRTLSTSVSRLSYTASSRASTNSRSVGSLSSSISWLSTSLSRCTRC